MAAPVRGLRAERARRWDVLNVPNPTKVIGSPFRSARVMPSRSDSTAAAALVFVAPVSLAIFAIRSCLFMPLSSVTTVRALSEGWDQPAAARRIHLRAHRRAHQLPAPCPESVSHPV